MQREAPAPRPAHLRFAGDLTGSAGLGFTDSPDTFLLGAELDFWQNDRIAIGPMLQLGLDDDAKLVAPSFHAKYRFPLDGEAARLAPFAQGGIGFLWLERERRGRDDDDLGLMLQAGGGLEWQVEERLFLSSSILFDLMPADVLGEHAIFTWQIVQFGWRF